MITAHPTVRQMVTKALVTARERTPFKELVRLLKSNSPDVDEKGSR
jgi:hypothetical protein